jgi:putative phage-type endonuclease
MAEIVDNLIKWLNLVEHTLLKPADRTQLDEWLQAAEDLTDGLSLEETAADLLVQQILDNYEECFQATYTSCPTPVISKEKLLALCAAEQIEQRTPAWYKQMGTILSASELGSLFTSPKSRAALILSKVNPSPRPSQPLAVPSHSMSAFDWGIRFEPVVKQIYNFKYKTTIQELGRLVSQTDRRCSASPDGLILEDPASIRTGRLIEIKCPVTRQPDGKVPKDYYTQMQMQLFVTDLEACDFVEAVFYSPYSSPLKKDGPGLFHGDVILIHTLNELGLEENGRYEYGPVSEEPPTEAWMPPLKPNEVITERIPWKLLEWHEQVVVRSATWWPKTEPFVEAFWLDVERARLDPSFLDEHLKKKVVEEEKCMIRL